MPGKLTTFEIMLDNQGGQVKAGDTVKGQVLVELSADMDVLEIRIVFTGQAHVEWSGSADYSISSLADVQTIVVTDERADEVYFNHIVSLFPPSTEQQRASRNDRKSVKLTKGSHSYDFSFRVPRTCPHTYHGTYGHVRYYLKGVVERAWHVAFNMRTVTVESHLELNSVPEARDPVSLCSNINIYNMFSRKGDCHATLRLPRKGALPGQVLPAEFSVHNRSDRDIHKVSMHFKMVVVFYSRSKKATTQVVIRKVALGKVPAWKTLEGRERSISIPSNCPPTGLPGCSLISVQYKLELRIKPAMLSPKRLKLTTDIIVGTEPLNDDADSPPDYWSIVPPSYDDVMDPSSRWVLTPSTITSTTPTTGATAAPPTAPLGPPPQFTHSLLPPPAYNDEPRLTVLRRPRSPSPPGEVTPRRSHPGSESSRSLIRPRANSAGAAVRLLSFRRLPGR